MKKLLFLLSVFVLSTLSAVSVYAGSWHRDNIGWWYRYDNGSCPTNKWFEDERGDWYYANSSGYILTNQWLKEPEGWYYVHNNGKMALNQWVGNYYLGEFGYMLTNTVTPDGYRVGADGAWVSSNEKYFDVSNGEFALTAEDIEYFNITDTMLQIRGKLYTYDPAGYTGDYVGYETQDYMISSYTLYYEKERMLSTGETTKEELLNNYRNGYVNVLMFKVSNGVVREVTIQTKHH